MTSIKDRSKLFEVNTPPVQPIVKVKPGISPRMCSFTPSNINNDLSKSQSNIKGENNLCRNSVTLPPNNATELNDESRPSVNVNGGNLTDLLGHSQPYNEKLLETSYCNKNVPPQSVIDNEISEKQSDISDTNSNKEINLKPNKSTGDDAMVDEDLVVSVPPADSTADEGEIEDSSDTDSLYDFSYEYQGSIYHLPGLENFIFPVVKDIVTEMPIANPSNQINSNDLLQEDPISSELPTIDIPKDILDHEPDAMIEVANNLKRTASKRLIEELFNTSVWRNSINYNDNFIFNPVTTTESPVSGGDSSVRITDISSINSISSSITSNDERRKSSTASISSSKPNIRNLFSGMFRSKRGAKKSHEKVASHEQINDIYDSNGHDKPANHSKTADGDTDSVEQVTKKPLNSIFNRDWLNSLGEGIKKKANVMSELRKVFTHGKTKHLKKKPQKSTSGASSLEAQRENLNKVETNSDEDIYDDGGDDNCSIEENLPKQILPPQKLFDKIKVYNQIQNEKSLIKTENEEDEIYVDDDEENDGNGSDGSETNESVYDDGGEAEDKDSTKNSSEESVYNDEDDEVIENENNLDMKSSSDESLYDDGGEELQDFVTQSDNLPQVLDVKMRPKKTNKLINNPIFNLTIPLKMSHDIHDRKHLVKDIVKSPMIKATVVNDSIYDDGGEDYEDDSNLNSSEKVTEIYEKKHKEFTDDNFGGTKAEKETGKSNKGKKSHKMPSEFKWLFQRKPKKKTKSEKEKGSEKKLKEDKGKNKTNPVPQSRPQNEEYDLDDENIEEDKPNVSGNKVQPVHESGCKNQLKDNVEEDIYDVDSDESSERRSNEKDIENNKPIAYQFLGNIRYSGKLPKKTNKNHKTLNLITNENEDIDDSKQSKTLHRVSEMHKKDKRPINKVNKKVVESSRIESSEHENARNGSKETKKAKDPKVLDKTKKFFLSSNKKKRADEVYDEDGPDENEVSVSGEINEEKETNLPKFKSTTEAIKLKNEKKRLEIKSKEKTSLFYLNPKKAFNEKESKLNKSTDQSNPETYIYDEDTHNESENEVYVSDAEIGEEKETDLPKSKTIPETTKSKKENDNKRLEIKKNEKTGIFSGKTKKAANGKECKIKKSTVKSKPETYIYDEDAPDENENEVYVSDAEIDEEKETDLPKSKTIPETTKSKKENDNKRLEIKKNEKTGIFSGKTKKAANGKECKIKKSTVKSKPETYIYDEDAPDENENEVYVSDAEIDEEKETNLPKSKTIPDTIKSKKENDNKRLEIKKNEKTSIFSGKMKMVANAKERKIKKSTVKSKHETYIYDEDAPDENENEVYVSDAEIDEENESNLSKSKTTPKTIKSKKEDKNKKLEIKKNEKTSIFSGKVKKPANEKESNTKKSSNKRKPETYIYDEDSPENPDNEAQDYNYLDDEFFNTDDPDINKMIKKNLNQARKVFKLNDNLIPVSLSKAVKTVFSQGKNHLQLNIGELVQVLEYKNDLALVRNGLGKCGWTMPGSLQIIKLYKAHQG